MPLFSSTTAFAILRVLMGMGRTITMNVPLIADYCEKDFAGLAGAYQNMVITLATLIATSGFYQLI